MTNNQSNEPEDREQTFDEKLDEIIWELTDSSAWDLIGITQEQADALSEQLRSDRVEAKQAIKVYALTVAERLINEFDKKRMVHDTADYAVDQLRTAFRKEYGGEE